MKSPAAALTVLFMFVVVGDRASVVEAAALVGLAGLVKRVDVEVEFDLGGNEAELGDEDDTEEDEDVEDDVELSEFVVSISVV